MFPGAQFYPLLYRLLYPLLYPWGQKTAMTLSNRYPDAMLRFTPVCRLAALDGVALLKNLRLTALWHTIFNGMPHEAVPFALTLRGKRVF